jgi:hypothetical protein
MRLPIDPRLPFNDDLKALKERLYRVLADIALQVNGVSEGSIQALHNSDTAAPSAGKYAKGDEIINSDPQELGSPGSKYVIEGWKCLVAGEPGTWVEKRFLTGN